jgi:hypothetical protein
VPEHQNRVSGPDAALGQRGPHLHVQDRSFLEGGRVRQLVYVGLGHEEELLTTAIAGNPQLIAGFAVLHAAAPAEEALAAANDLIDCYTIACADSRNTGPNRHDFAGNLMAQDQGWRGQPNVTGHDVDVSSAYAHSLDPDCNLPRRRLGRRTFSVLEPEPSATQPGKFLCQRLVLCVAV